MNLALDLETEHFIQSELDRGHYREPAQVIQHAVSLLKAEQDWLETTKPALNQRLEESITQIARGEGIPGDQILEVLAQRRQAHS